MDKTTYDFKIRMRSCPFCHSEEPPRMYIADGGVVGFLRCRACGVAVKHEVSFLSPNYVENYFKAGIALVNKWNGVYDYKSS